jgi:hypothetical protein
MLLARAAAQGEKFSDKLLHMSLIREAALVELGLARNSATIPDLLPI